LTFISPGKNQSSWFYVMRAASRDIDTLRLTVMADYRPSEVFLFHWDFGNSSAEKYDQSAKLLMSFLVGYVLAVFAFYLRFDSEYFTQVFLLVIGVTGVFAGNPLNYFSGVAPGSRVSDHIFMAVFIAVFRVFALLQLELLRTDSHTHPKGPIIALAAVFLSFLPRNEHSTSKHIHKIGLIGVPSKLGIWSSEASRTSAGDFPRGFGQNGGVAQPFLSQSQGATVPIADGRDRSPGMKRPYFKRVL
jgi:hypothetical protein